MKLLEAWNFLQDSIFLARPYVNADGSFISFGVDFHDAIDITPVENKKWLVEFGYFSIEHNNYVICVESVFSEKTYEEVIIKLAGIIKNNYSNELLSDYYHIDKDWELKTLKLSNGNFQMINLGENKSGYNYNEVIDKIRSFNKKGE